jgi:hypothetical protein
MNKIQRFLTILFVGVLCSAIPFAWFSMAIGFPAILVNTIMLSLIFKRELYETK